ncbi:chorismate--pyruvate lyase [Paraglaciecola arctica BSs20135]|uniref:Probable chorismate pyruvate-lyase n=1 Tax=Paraglaciecola arctica BSs20135 TaxID=493475 RepID=K6XMN8_9ALTE|nr:chorismate--pyruvate lyase [Paraglaciecola arctica BSs20135]
MLKLNSSYTFPIGIPSLWAEPEQITIPSPCLKNWLLDTSSLTERLQSQCRLFNLTLIGQRQTEITLEEFQRVCAPQQQFNPQEWQVREVLLWGDNQPWVFARSIIPQILCENDFVNLNTKPLGKLIFNDERFKRMPFEITEICPSKAFLAQLHISSEMNLWGRRSVFSFEGLKMSVSEVFLPRSPAYQEMK